MSITKAQFHCLHINGKEGPVSYSRTSVATPGKLQGVGTVNRIRKAERPSLEYLTFIWQKSPKYSGHKPVKVLRNMALSLAMQHEQHR
jgi:hypothetical protein